MIRSTYTQYQRNYYDLIESASAYKEREIISKKALHSISRVCDLHKSIMIKSDFRARRVSLRLVAEEYSMQNNRVQLSQHLAESAEDADLRFPAITRNRHHPSPTSYP